MDAGILLSFRKINKFKFKQKNICLIHLQLNLRILTKAFGDVQAVRNLNFSIKKGSACNFAWSIRMGKTTTLRLIAGLEMVTEGHIFIGDKEVTKISASERDVSMVFQSYALFPHMTVMQNVSYGLTMSRLRNKKYKKNHKPDWNWLVFPGFGGNVSWEISRRTAAAGGRGTCICPGT
ncbi:MAG: hypothetical protein CM1200mP16_14830 [Nitrospina sp.]|nr:MAG: hypothetical protein CM1200mP16_14830 [Nitrospina sp.]